MGLVWGFASSGWLRGSFVLPVEKKGGPITVDVVRLPEKKAAREGPRDIVRLPPLSTQRLSKESKTPTHLSDRTQSVEKETHPAPGRAVARYSPPAAAAPAPGPSKARRGGARDGSTVARPSRKGAPGEETYSVARRGVDGGAKGRVAIGRPKGPGETVIVPPRPSLFPTEARIAELTRRYESEPQKGERGKVLQLNTSESKYARYVNDSLVPPIEFRMGRSTAARKGWLGNLLINFTVKKDGSLGNIELVRSSGNPALDDDTIISLRLAAPFPPLPEKFGMDEITINGIFVYY